MDRRDCDTTANGGVIDRRCRGCMFSVTAIEYGDAEHTHDREIT